MDLKALGFDIAEGVNDPYLPGDCGIFVTRVDKGSVADGRLRYELPGDACTHFSPRQQFIERFIIRLLNGFQGERLAAED